MPSVTPETGPAGCNPFFHLKKIDIFEKVE